MWRNWQTRMIQVHVGRLVQVQVLLSALLKPMHIDALVFYCFMTSSTQYFRKFKIIKYILSFRAQMISAKNGDQKWIPVSVIRPSFIHMNAAGAQKQKDSRNSWIIQGIQAV